MLTPQDNERMTRVGAGTPMGALLRRYWQPALLTSELPEHDGAPVRVRLLGEDLVAFRDTNGDVGLVDAFCPHRRAPMFFGRNEECGLRCVYHGWKFDKNGTCVDMPSEPPDSLFKTKVTIGAYPVWEGGGMLWAYLGPRDQQPRAARLRAAARARDAPLYLEDDRGLQLAAGARRRARHLALLVRAQPRHQEHIVPAQRRHRAASRDRENALRLHLCRHPQDRGPAVRARLSLRVAGAADARPRARAQGRHGKGADDQRPHLGADRRRDDVRLQLAVLLRSGDSGDAGVCDRARDDVRARSRAI